MDQEKQTKDDDSMTPLHLTLMISCYISTRPWQVMGSSVWASEAGIEVRRWLSEEGLVDACCRPTDRGKAWIEALLSTELPDRSLPMSAE